MLRFHNVILNYVFWREVPDAEAVEMCRAFLESHGIERDPAEFYEQNRLLENADSLGLDWWGELTNVPRIDVVNYFGFRGSGFFPFRRRPFWNERYEYDTERGRGIVIPLEPDFTADDDLYRLYIYKRVMDLISGNKIPPEEDDPGGGGEGPARVEVKTLTDFFDLAMITVLSQYSASPRIMGIIENFCAKIDPKADLQTFYDEIFNLDTARGVGLDVWGAIVGIGRRITGTSDRQYFGYLGSLLQPFDQCPFYSHDGAAVNDYNLLDEPYRDLIKFKAAANISSAEAPALNDLLNRLLPGTGVFVRELAPMQIVFVFQRYLTEYELTLFKAVGVALKGAGVGWWWIECDIKHTFGFAGSDLQPFNQGVFDLFVQGGFLQHHYLYDPDQHIGFNESGFQPFKQGVFALER